MEKTSEPGLERGGNRPRLGLGRDRDRFITVGGLA